MMHVTILSRPDCHLCTVVEKMARRADPSLDLLIQKENIEETPGRLAQYGEAIPVVLVDGREICRGLISEGALHRALALAVKKARWRQSISRILSRLCLTARRG